MDDGKVNACNETYALSQSAYVLFYAREGAWEGGAGGGAAAPVGADPTEPGQPAGDASGRAPGSEESPGDTEVEGMSLEQWRRLQEHGRPKPALELRKVQSALPAGAVVIHQSKHGGGRSRPNRSTSGSTVPARTPRLRGRRTSATALVPAGGPEPPRGRTRSRGRLWGCGGRSALTHMRADAQAHAVCGTPCVTHREFRRGASSSRPCA